MKKLDQNTLIGIFALLTFIGFFIYIYNQGRRKGTFIADIGDDYIKPGFSPDKFVEDGKRILSNWVNNSLRNDYFQSLNNLSDGELKTVYNAYNQKYLTSGQTFVELIKAAFMPLIIGVNYKTLVLDRFNRMSLP